MVCLWCKQVMADPETYNLEFKATVGTQKRITINTYVNDIAELKPGDKIKLVLKEVTRKEVKP